jgi:O-methyltransferase
VLSEVLNIVTLLRRSIKKVLISGWLSPSRKLDYLNLLLLFGRWLKNHHPKTIAGDRYDLFEYVNAQVLTDTPITYLEFGVYKGDSIKYWSEMNSNPESEFFGFDSFEGLPTDWILFKESIPKGHFSTGGMIPQFNDPRVNFLKGLFQDALPPFLDSFRPKNRLLVHCDADLYSSELFVLTSLNRLLIPGSIVIFDDFGAVNHDFKAFIDYAESYMREYDVLAFSDKYYSSTTIQML